MRLGIDLFCLALVLCSLALQGLALPASLEQEVREWTEFLDKLVKQKKDLDLLEKELPSIKHNLRKSIEGPEREKLIDLYYKAQPDIERIPEAEVKQRLRDVLDRADWIGLNARRWLAAAPERNGQKRLDYEAKKYLEEWNLLAPNLYLDEDLKRKQVLEGSWRWQVLVW